MQEVVVTRFVIVCGCATLGVTLSAWQMTAIMDPPSFLYSSALIVVLLIVVVLRHGLVSTPTIVCVAAFSPALSFFWAYLNGASYINSQNHWLQDADYYVNSAVFLSAIAFCLAVATLFAVSQRTLNNGNVIKRGRHFGPALQTAACLGVLFFVWLTEPAFSTIIASGSTVVKSGKIDGTQFAGALAILCWLPAFVTYVSTCGAGANPSTRRRQKMANSFFLCTTALAVIWLILHARRSELIGMGLILLLVIRETRGARTALLLSAALMLVLSILGALRTIGLLAFFETLGDTGGGDSNIVQLPGGASNVFLTFVDTIHFYKTNALLMGETFINYLLQIFPSFFYDLFAIDRPAYFFQETFMQNYSYRGGTYLLAPFYGNFGVFGVLIGGVFVGLFAISACRFISSKKIELQLIGLFMIAFVFRGYWYELITLIKPIVVILLPTLLVLAALGANRSIRT